MSSLFKEVNNENINEYCLSIDRCRLNLTSIYFILDSYEIIRNDPEKGITLLNAQLDGVSKTIESEIVLLRINMKVLVKKLKNIMFRKEVLEEIKRHDRHHLLIQEVVLRVLVELFHLMRVQFMQV